MYTIGQIVFAIHILAFAAVGANAVFGAAVGQRLDNASPELRDTLLAIFTTVGMIGRYAIFTLLVTGLLVWWMKWNFAIPNAWFWVKLGGVAATLILVIVAELNFRRAQAGDRVADKRAELYGTLVSLGFLVVLVASIFAFDTGGAATGVQ